MERVKSTTKSKAHSKEKISTTTLLSTPLVPNKEEQIESVTEPIPKPSKSKKNTIVPLSADVDTDISATTSINASVSSALINSIVSSNKHKVKLAKKSKKIAPQPHPAFYYVSTYKCKNILKRINIIFTYKIYFHILIIY